MIRFLRNNWLRKHDKNKQNKYSSLIFMGMLQNDIFSPGLKVQEIYIYIYLQVIDFLCAN